jgi:hypothetical protein
MTINLFDALKEMGGAKMTYEILNSYMLFYNKYYRTNENILSGVTDPKDPNSSNHAMELFRDFIQEYTDNNKIVANVKPLPEFGEYYILSIKNVPQYYGKSFFTLLLKVVKDQLIYDDWDITFSED